MTKLPFLKFYPNDWISDSVAGCSLAAQGLWLRLMFLMHNSERYGYLCQGGAPPSLDSICRQVGCPPEEYEPLLAELVKAGVPSYAKGKIIYSRRMVRDADKRADDRGRQASKRQREKSEQKTDKKQTQNGDFHSVENSEAPLKPMETKAECHASVTAMSQGEVRGQRSEVRDNSPLPPSPAAKPAAAGGVADGHSPTDPDEAATARSALRDLLASHSLGRFGDPGPKVVGKLLRAAGGETVAAYESIRDALADLKRVSNSVPSGWGWYQAVIPPMLGQTPEEGLKA